jgi:hypothetical protein
VKRVLHWLLKIFFACSIGFVVPVRDFGDLNVIGNACILFIAVLGKPATANPNPDPDLITLTLNLTTLTLTLTLTLT